MENLNHSLSAKVVAALGVVALGLVGFVGAASAQVDPDDAATSIVNAGTNSLGPVVVAVATACIGLLALIVAVRMAFGAVRSKGQSIG